MIPPVGIKNEFYRQKFLSDERRHYHTLFSVISQPIPGASAGAVQDRAAASIASRLVAGVPGETPPPTDRIMPPPGAALSRQDLAHAATAWGVSRTATSNGGTLPIKATRCPI